MGLFSKNQNRHGLIGRFQNMYERCCEPEPEECCTPVEPCVCSFADYLRVGGIVQPISFNQDIGDIPFPENELEFFIQLENTGTCYLSTTNVEIEVTDNGGIPVQATIVNTGYDSGERKDFIKITLPVGVEPGDYNVTASFIACIETRAAVAVNFTIDPPVQFDLRVGFYNLIDDGFGNISLGSEIPGTTSFYFEIDTIGTEICNLGTAIFTEGELQGAVVFMTPIYANQQVDTFTTANLLYTAYYDLESGLPAIYNTVDGEQILDIFVADTSTSGASLTTLSITIQTSGGYNAQIIGAQSVYPENAYSVSVDFYDIMESTPGDYLAMGIISSVYSYSQIGNGFDPLLGAPISFTAGAEKAFIMTITPLHYSGVIIDTPALTGPLTKVNSTALGIDASAPNFSIAYGSSQIIAMLYLDNYNAVGVHAADADVNINGGAPAGPFETTLDLTYEAL